MPTPIIQPGDDNLLDRFATINIWHRGEERAPHKPLLLLYALAALQRGEDRPLEAAHIHWHSHGGPDTEENGLALCANHRKAFDRGALGLDDDHRFLISQHLRNTKGARDWLIRFTGQPLRGPQPGCASPAAVHLAWHRKEVFRDPPWQSAET